jgi:mannose-6-phosphate isomerase-like protein (cupin superfamily)
LERKEEETADEVWALIEGEATFEWEDRRSVSPTSGGKASLAAREPITILVPFGVTFRVTAGNGAAILLRLSTHADDEERLPRPFREEPLPQ